MNDYSYGYGLLAPIIKKIATRAGMPGIKFIISRVTMKRVFEDDSFHFISVFDFLITAAILIGCEKTNGVVIL